MKILIVSDSLRVGGVQKALVDFVNNLVELTEEVDLFLFNNENPNGYSICSKVRLLPSGFLLKIMNYTSTEARKKGLLVYILRGVLAIIAVLIGSKHLYYIVLKRLRFEKEYDIAISFTNNVNNKSLYFGSNMFVLNNVVASKKFTWIHIYPTKQNIINKTNYEEYLKFDKIVCVSMAVKKAFDSYWPDLANKTYVVYNFINERIIDFKKRNSIVKQDSLFRLITISRLDSNKSPTSVVEVSKLLKAKGCLFRWYVVGDGPLKNKLHNEISKNQLQDSIIFLGEISSPYEYICTSNLLVSFSKSESFGLAIMESLFLNTPVLANYYDAIPEIIAHGVNGLYYCYEPQKFAQEISRMIDDMSYYANVKINAKSIISNSLVSTQLKKILYDG